MLCQNCESQTRRFGRNRSGSQRYRCDVCRATFTDDSTLTVDRRRVEEPRMTMCLRMLLEGMSIRSTVRLTGTGKKTILDALVDAGEKCRRFLDCKLRNLDVDDVEVDEVWGFIGCKERTRERRNYPAEICGDAYTFTAVERTTKLLIAWHLGKRSEEDTMEFSWKLRDATAGRFQLTTDGYRPYLFAIPTVFRNNVDYATLVKVYGIASEDEQRRYSPGEVVDVIATDRIGRPDPERICTSIVERSNLTWRMTIRRLTRLTNAFSKSWVHHESALALVFAAYNFVRPHITLNERMRYKCTPAMAAGLTDRVWTLPELLQRAGEV
jgi:IS1 family transposase/transposase-like protein